MEKLEKYGVQEMNAVEMRAVDGGLPWVSIVKWTERALVAIGAADAIDEFCEGWKSVKCAKK